jgi:hypothetical protein
MVLSNNKMMIANTGHNTSQQVEHGFLDLSFKFFQTNTLVCWKNVPFNTAGDPDLEAAGAGPSAISTFTSVLSVDGGGTPASSLVGADIAFHTHGFTRAVGLTEVLTLQPI